jgi:hypothetical protein
VRLERIVGDLIHLPEPFLPLTFLVSFVPFVILVGPCPSSCPSVDRIRANSCNSWAQLLVAALLRTVHSRLCVTRRQSFKLHVVEIMQHFFAFEFPFAQASGSDLTFNGPDQPMINVVSPFPFRKNQKSLSGLMP